jgi:hypothetical protein
MNGSFLVSFLLESGYLEKHSLPPELMLWLCQVSLSDPCQGLEIMPNQAFQVLTSLWKVGQNPFGRILFNISNLAPLLQMLPCDPSIIAKFLQVFVLAVRGGAVGMDEDGDKDEVVRFCIVALTRAGLDSVFHVEDGSR